MHISISMFSSDNFTNPLDEVRIIFKHKVCSSATQCFATAILVIFGISKIYR